MEGHWEYPSLAVVMLAAVMEEVDTYILLRQNTIAQYIVTCSVLELCLEVERSPGAWVMRIW